MSAEIEDPTPACVDEETQAVADVDPMGQVPPPKKKRVKSPAQMAAFEKAVRVRTEACEAKKQERMRVAAENKAERQRVRALQKEYLQQVMCQPVEVADVPLPVEGGDPPPVSGAKEEYVPPLNHDVLINKIVERLDEKYFPTRVVKKPSPPPAPLPPPRPVIQFF